MTNIQFHKMRNQAMANELVSAKAIDVSKCRRDGEYYVLDKFTDDDVDYCDASSEQWVWSIGRRLKDGVILASLTPDLYLNPEFECLWLR